VHRIIRQRTHALQHAAEGDRRFWEAQGAVWTETLIPSITLMWSERLAYVEYVNTHLRPLLERLGGMNVLLQLRLRLGGMEGSTGLPSEEEVATAFERTRASEELLGRTLIGPHRDGVDVLIDGRPGLHRLSRGQRRLFLLALHILEGDRIRAGSDHGILYAFDDVFSELDDSHRREIGTVLADQQVVLTTADPHILTFLPEARVYGVENGVVTQLSGRERTHTGHETHLYPSNARRK
jgi:DNA replication and repair protein RecF